MEVPVYVTSLSSLAAFKVLCIWQFNYVSQCSPIGVQPILDPLGLMDLDVHFSLQVWEVSNHYCFKYTFLFSSPSGIPITWLFFLLILSHLSCRLSSLFFILFSCSSDWVIPNALSSRSLILLHGWIYCSSSLLNSTVVYSMYFSFGICWLNFCSWIVLFS